MNAILRGLRQQPMLILLVFVPALFITWLLQPEAHAALFILSILAIVPLAALLSHATEAVAEKTGDAIGGLLNASLGNLTELIIALTALKAGQYLLVKSMIVGAIVGNSLFMLGACFLVGGLKYRFQEFNRANARMQAAMLFLATVALLAPSAYANADASPALSQFIQQLSLGLACLLIVAYGLGMYFSLGTHREVFAAVRSSSDTEEGHEVHWPMSVALTVLAVVTVLVALVSDIFVESLQAAAETFGMTPAFVGFVVVALVGAAAEIFAALSGARKNRLDLSVGIALGSASQIALFVAPVLVLLSYFTGGEPMNLQFWPGAIVMMLIAALTTALVTSSGRSAWFLGVMMLVVYVVFAMTLFLLPPQTA
ncbi:MAG: calcium/proton exchanger [Pedobacter sp.]|nr:calcium/proton exchanger [Pedobacter sp.]